MDTSVRPLYFLAEAFNGIRRNLLATIIAISTVALSMVILGSFIAIATNISAMIKEVERKVEITVYVHDNATSEEILDFENKVRRMDEVQSVQFISKEEALERLKEQLKDQPDLYKSLDGNPLPASLEIKLSDPQEVKSVAKKLNAKQSIIDEVRFGKDIVERLFTVTRIMRWIGSAFIFILCVASLVVIANTIRLAIFARRTEIGIMKLVGGTNWFIRWPFVLEGIIQGLLGSVAAIVLLVLINKYIFQSISEILQWLNVSGSPISMVEMTAYILLAGTGIGAIGSLLALRKYLHI